MTRGKGLKLGNLGLGLDLASFHFHFRKFPLNTCIFIFSVTFPFPALYLVSIYFPLPFISCLTLNRVYLLYFNIGYFNFNYIFVDLLFSQLLCYLIFILMLWIFIILILFVMGFNQISSRVCNWIHKYLIVEAMVQISLYPQLATKCQVIDNGSIG